MKYDDNKLGKLFEKHVKEFKENLDGGKVILKDETFLLIKEDCFYQILEKITNTVQQYIEEYKE